MGPVLVTVEPDRTAKVPDDPRTTGAGPAEAALVRIGELSVGVVIFETWVGAGVGTDAVEETAGLTVVTTDLVMLPVELAALIVYTVDADGDTTLIPAIST